MVGIIHELTPLDESVEDDLITQFISYLTHSRISINESDDDDYGNSAHVSLLNTNKRLDRKYFIILKKIIKELIKKPFVICDKTLGKTNFKKLPHYDYEEEVMDSVRPSHKHDDFINEEYDDYKYKHRPRSRSKRTTDYD